MNAGWGVADILRPRTICRRTASEPLQAGKPLRLVPRTAADELPPFGEQVSLIDGRPQRGHDPIWRLASGDRW